MSKLTDDAFEIAKACYPEGFDCHDSEAAGKVLARILKEERQRTLRQFRAILKKRSQKDFTMHPTEYSNGKQAFATFVFRSLDKFIEEVGK